MCADQFKELLEVIYPSHKPVNADNIDYLLTLADQYQIDYVMMEGEKFLCGADDVSVEAKLALADRYRFSKLQVNIAFYMNCNDPEL